MKSKFTGGLLTLSLIALIALLGFTTKGFQDWTFGGLIPDKPISSSSSENPGSIIPSTSSSENPVTSSSSSSSSETPVTSENPTTSVSTSSGTLEEPITPPEEDPIIHETKIEAEECTLVTATKQNSLPWASNEFFVGGFGTGSSITFTFTAEKAVRGSLEIALANITEENILLSSIENFLVLNDEALVFTEQTVEAPTAEEIQALATEYPEQAMLVKHGVFKTISIDIELKEGNNTVVLNGKNNTFNVDYFNFKTTAKLQFVAEEPVDNLEWGPMLSDYFDGPSLNLGFAN